MIGIPTTEQVRAWVGVPAGSVPDAELAGMLAAELDLQAKTLRIPADPAEDGTEATYPDPLARALLRRVQRQIAAKAAPLGLIGDGGGEFGAAYLRSWDPEIRRLEDPYRRVVVA